jgi:hypothetical protein
MPRLSLHECLYFYCIILLCATLVCFCYLVSTPSGLPCIVLGFQMSVSPLPHIGFADGTRCSNQNLSFISWKIYAPKNNLISLHGVCLGRATNNIAEYREIIEFLTDAISLGICHLVAWLDSHIVVLQPSNVYAIQSPTLLRVYL